MGKGPPPRASRPDFGSLLPRADDPEALVRANRLAALGTLVAGVAHEINNPISYVLGNLSELETLGSAMREALSCYRQSLVCEAGSSGAVRAEQIEKKLEEAGGLALLEELLADAQEGAGRIRDLIRGDNFFNIMPARIRLHDDGADYRRRKQNRRKPCVIALTGHASSP